LFTLLLHIHHQFNTILNSSCCWIFARVGSRCCSTSICSCTSVQHESDLGLAVMLDLRSDWFALLHHIHFAAAHQFTHTFDFGVVVMLDLHVNWFALLLHIHFAAAHHFYVDMVFGSSWHDCHKLCVNLTCIHSPQLVVTLMCHVGLLVILIKSHAIGNPPVIMCDISIKPGLMSLD
jgi:hypothetical protein